MVLSEGMTRLLREIAWDGSYKLGHIIGSSRGRGWCDLSNLVCYPGRTGFDLCRTGHDSCRAGHGSTSVGLSSDKAGHDSNGKLHVLGKGCHMSFISWHDLGKAWNRGGHDLGIAWTRP